MRFYERLFRIDLRLLAKDAAGRYVGDDPWYTLDWGYTPMLYMHGYTSVGSIPNLAIDLEFPPDHQLRQHYVQPERCNAGLVRRRTAG